MVKMKEVRIHQLAHMLFLLLFLCVSIVILSNKVCSQSMIIETASRVSIPGEEVSTGGGGSAGGYYNYQIINETKYLIMCFDILKKEYALFEINDKELGLEKVQFFYDSLNKDVCINMDETTIEKTNLNILKNNVYKTFKIDLINANQSDISNITLVISIDNKWLIYRNFSSAYLGHTKNITSKYFDKFPLMYLSHNAEYTYFETTISGFSVFFIAAELKPEYKIYCSNQSCNFDENISLILNDSIDWPEEDVQLNTSEQEEGFFQTNLYWAIKKKFPLLQNYEDKELKIIFIIYAIFSSAILLLILVLIFILIKKIYKRNK